MSRSRVPLEYFLSQKNEYDALRLHRNLLIGSSVGFLFGAAIVLPLNRTLAATGLGVSAITICGSRLNGKRLDHLGEMLQRCSVYEVEARQDVFTSHLGGLVEPVDEPQPEPPQPFVPVDLRSMSFHHLMILGPTGFGKSTLTGYLLDNLQGSTVVVDPHSTPNTWGNLPVVGMGRNYEEIEEFLGVLMREMDSRYERRMKGDSSYPIINIVVDEFPSVAKSIDSKKFKETVQALLCEARKVNMKLILLSQGKSVKTIGLEGQSELLENLTIIRGGSFAMAHAKSLTDELLIDWLRQQNRPATVNNDGLLIPDLSAYNPTLNYQPCPELTRLLGDAELAPVKIPHQFAPDLEKSEPPIAPSLHQFAPVQDGIQDWENITPEQQAELVQRIQKGESQNQIMKEFFKVRKGHSQRYKNAKKIYDGVREEL